MAKETRRITVWLPQSLLAYIDSVAKQRGVSRSRIVVGALEEMREQAAAEGYRLYSEEALEFAQATEQIAAETWPVWDSELGSESC